MNTYKTCQELFNIVVAHLRQQKQRCVVQKEGGYSCVYRGPNNTKCAIGALIPDEAYLPEFDANTESEDTGFIALSRKNESFIKALQAGGVDMCDGRTQDLLIDLQGIHDTDEPANWEAAFESEAKHHCLEMPA